MTPPPPPAKGAHDEAVDQYVDRRLAEIRGDGPVGKRRDAANPPRGARDAILSFLKSKKGEVGRLHFRNYVAWLPVAADRLGDSFLSPGPGVQGRFNEAFPPKGRDGRAGYSFFSRQTVGGILMGFWRYRLTLESKPFPDYLRLKFGKWKSPYNGSDMLTREDVVCLAEAVDNFRDRAWIWANWSGCRPGEIYSLRVGDVVPRNGYLELRVRREKDSENVPAFVYEDGVPAILAWLRAHPLRDDPKAPLWVSLRSEERGRPAGYRALYKVIEVAARRAKIGKPVTLYHLRRSRLTELAKDPAINQSILEKVAGWATGSKVAKHYVHLNADDVRAALSRRYGVGAKAAEEAHRPARVPRDCPRCRTVNPVEANFCGTCGGPLNPAAMGRIVEVEEKAKRLAALLRKPEVARFLANQLAAQSAAGR